MPTKKLKVLDLFSGIGGFSLGLQRTNGFETVAFCEIEDFPKKVLKKHWADVPIYEDVKNVTRKRLVSDGIPRIDVVTGGFPCQDLSIAGNQKGIEAERSGLWSELCRIIGDVRPRYAIVENVTALISGDNGRWFGKVLGDLAEIGYDAEWHCIPASELGAHHHRDRVWIIAYASEQRWNDRRDNREERHLQNNEEWGTQEVQQQGNKRINRSGEICEVLADTLRVRVQKGDSKDRGCPKVPQQRVESNTNANRVGKRFLSNTISKRQPRQGEYVKPLLAEAIKNWQAINAESGCISGIWSVEPELGRVANGIPDRSHRLKGLGNAVVPQITELIGRAILEAENDKTRT